MVILRRMSRSRDKVGMIMTYLAVLLYPLVYKVKTALVEIIYGRGKFVGDFIWVHYKGMWIKKLPYMSY
jgi:hypothetical protein